MVTLWLASEPGFSVGTLEPVGIYSTDLEAQEALQAKTGQPIDWQRSPGRIRRDWWYGGTARNPVKTVGGFPIAGFEVRPLPLNGLAKFIRALSEDDYSDLRDLVRDFDEADYDGGGDRR